MTRFSTLLGTLVILFVGACITPAEVDFAEAEQELVVYSHFGVDEPMKIYLTHTRDPLKPNEPFKPVESATIKVYEDERFLGQFDHSHVPGKKSEYVALYDTGVKVTEGSSYQIEVMAEGYKNARSTEIVPHHKANVRSFDFIEEDEGRKLYRLLFSDDETKDNYYQLIIKLLEKDMSDSIVSEELVDYRLVRSAAYTHFNSDTRSWTAIYPEYAGFLFTGVKGEGDLKELFIEIANEEGTISEAHTYKVELHNVSDAYFLYHQSVQAQLTNENALTDPVRIYNNIEGGFGNFSAYNAATAEVGALRVGD